MTDEQFKIESTDQVARLGVFDSFRFMETPARKEYRKFFEQRTRDISKVTAVIDEAVILEQMPTVAVISQIWHRLYVSLSTEAEITERDRSERADYLRKWYEQERREAEERRKKFAATLTRNSIPVTDAEIVRLASGGNTAYVPPITGNQRRTIEADIERLLAKKRETETREGIGIASE